MLKILLVEDSAADAELAAYALGAAGIDAEIERVSDEEAFREALAQRPDVVISDGNVPGFGGLRALAIARAESPEVPFIVLSGDPWEYGGQQALDAGATDYVCKADLRALGPAILRSLR